MMDLPYSLVIEATKDREFFGFYSPDLEGFTGTGLSVVDCLYQARKGMKEHIALLATHELPIPLSSSNPTIAVEQNLYPAD